MCLAKKDEIKKSDDEGVTCADKEGGKKRRRLRKCWRSCLWELNLTGSEIVVRTETNEVSLTNLKVSSSKAGDSRERTRRYGFDFCFDSSDPEAKDYANQAAIYEKLGQPILDTMFTGYNSCLVAYGQSASGKTYTMMGTREDPGLIPRLCKGLFSRIEKEAGDERIYRVTISYLEIYNERVRDLLKPSTSVSRLRVREHPRLGPYVQGLTHHVVRTLGSLMSYVEEGTKARKTASTHQNPSSSRSHALLTIALSQETAKAEHPGASSSSSRRQEASPRGGSRLHLVDLAGSESAATCGGVHRLKEGANINKSLVALGNVISALVERGSTGSGPGRKYIPYRDSSLTWLLKDALGGNATTIMLATISPASGSYNETAHTLRFAQRAQSVVNRPVVNEDPVARLIRELRAEVSRLKSLLHEKDIDQQSKIPCCCGKVQSSKDPATVPREERRVSLDTTAESDPNGKPARLKDDECDVLPIRRFNSTDSVTTYETDSPGSIRKFNSYEYLRSQDRFVGNYNRAKVTELNDEENEVVNEINEPVFVDIPTLVAVLIKPDDTLQESSTQIEEISSDEVQEDSIDTDFIEAGNEVFGERINDHDDLSNSRNSCNALEDSGIEESQQTSSECPPDSPAFVQTRRVKRKFNKQNSVDLPWSNLNISKQFSSVEGINKRKEPIFALQRSHTNVEKRSTLPERGKKLLNNICEIDDRKANNRSGGIKAIDKDYHRRKSSNDSDKSLKDSGNSRNGSYHSIGRKPSLESLKRKTSKDSSSSSSKEDQILISGLARDKLLHQKNSLEQEAAAGSRNHTSIQRATRAEIVAAVTERLYSSRKHTEELNNMPNNATGLRSPPEGANDAKIAIGGSAARAKLQEISRKMLLRRRRITAETQTQMTSTVRLKDTASLTDEPKIVLQDAAVLTDDHEHCDVFVTSDRLPVLRMKEVATLTDRPRTDIFWCKDAECSTNDLDYDECELRSPRNDSGILSDDTQNYADGSLSNAEASELYAGRRTPCRDSSTNTLFSSRGRDSAVQTPRQQTIDEKDTRCRHCCGLAHEPCQRTPASNPEKNVISISLPDMLSITIESTNGLESRIAVTDGSDLAEEKPKPISSNKETQTDERAEDEVEDSSLRDPSIRSTAVQADGRVFRIENIFQDPRSKSCSDVTSDLRRQTTMENSVTFRSSLGTSPVIETEENSTDMDWNRTRVEKYNRSKKSIPKDGLIRTFIARRRSYSSSPRRRTCKLDRYDLWKNWTVPYPEKVLGLVDCSKASLSSSQPETDIGSIDDLIASTVSDECISVDEISEETCCKFTEQVSTGDFKSLEKLKSHSMNGLDCEHNFSDDSLDYNEENGIAGKYVEAKTMGSHDSKTFKDLCPPDVVAHTKKESSKSANHTDSANVESSIDNDFENTKIEFPKTKPTGMLDENLMHDYKSLILGTSSHTMDSDTDKGTIVRTSCLSDNANKKKVSFSNSNSPEKTNDTSTRCKSFVPKQNSEITLKSIIRRKKKKKKLVERSDVVQSNIESNQPSQQQDVKSTGSAEISLALREKQDSEDSEELLNDRRDKKEKFSDENCLEEPRDELAGVVGDADTRASRRAISRKNILEKYLNEAINFMRNMNSINEYMNATNVLDGCGKHRRKQRARRANNPSTNNDHVELRKDKANLKDDTDKYPQSDENEIVLTESYDRCLKGIERLEACIGKVSEHNQVLCDRYGIDVESAGAKSNLAIPSLDSKLSAVTRNNAIGQCGDAVCKSSANEPNSSRTTVSFLSSSQADTTKSSALRKEEKHEAVFEIDDFDDGNVNVSQDDLERRVFDQLMDAADSSRYWSMKKLQQKRRFWKTWDFRSRSPMTYSKTQQQTLCQDTQKILDFDAISDTEDYLDSILGIDINSQECSKPKLMTTAIDSEISIGSRMNPEKSRERNKLSKENSGLLEIELSNDPTIFETKVQAFNYSIDPVKSTVTERRLYEEDEVTSRNMRSRNSLRIESMNPRFNEPLGKELKYPGSPRAKFLELLRERRRIVESTRGTNAF